MSALIITLAVLSLPFVTLFVYVAIKAWQEED